MIVVGLEAQSSALRSSGDSPPNESLLENDLMASMFTPPNASISAIYYYA